jgi:dienelactone hydrolase
MKQLPVWFSRVPVTLFVVLATVIARPALAWEGFDWNTWKEISEAQPPEVSSPQAGQSELLPLLSSEALGSATIESSEAWEAKRKRIVEVLEQFLGTPGPIETPEPTAEILGEEDMGSYVRRHIRIASESDDWIPAYLLMPKALLENPSPTMIVLHQTQAPGKLEACGMTGDPNMAFAKELVERGYICIAPDAIGFGERIPDGAQPYSGAHDFYRKHPNWSFFGKMNWDVQRVVDYLETIPEVDAARIGCMGHSHGAYGTIVGAAFEPRISAAIASCGFTTLRTDPRPDRWSHLTALFPRLGFYVDDVESAPFDWHEIVACIAPRALLNYGTLNDGIFPNTDNLSAIYLELGDVYRLYDASERFDGVLVTGPHSIPADVRQLAYHWLDRQFGVNPATNE